MKHSFISFQSNLFDRVYHQIPNEWEFGQEEGVRMLSAIWVAFLVLALVCGTATGRLDAVTTALGTGAGEAITLLIGITGLMCFWSGVMELVQASGLSAKLSHALMPLLKPLFGKAAEDRQAMEAVSANVAANLLG